MFQLHSRVHPLNHFPSKKTRCFVKRDDELSAGVCGSKLRKYQSLIPFLLAHHYQHVLVIAGAQSNNLLAALQLLTEHNIKITAFLLKPWTVEKKGNFKLSSLFLNDEDIHWVDRNNWSKVSDLAAEFSLKHQHCFVLNEGASVPAALGGAKSLAYDILSNEKELALNFSHIFIDAGTGFSACGLIKGLDESKHLATVYVVLLADSEQLFRSRLKQWIGEVSINIQCITPATAKSFGSVNQTIRDTIRTTAQEEGILVDPIYSAKLFYQAKKTIDEKKLSGDCLLIHSGGILSLPNFEFN